MPDSGAAKIIHDAMKWHRAYPDLNPLWSFSKAISKLESGFSAGRVAAEDGVISSECQTRPVVEIEPCAHLQQRRLNHAPAEAIHVGGPQEVREPQAGVVRLN